MKSLNLADFLPDEGGIPTPANRVGLLNLLSFLKGSRTWRLDVPWGHYAANLTAADKPTVAQLNPNRPGGPEPGDAAIARFLIEQDILIEGEGADRSILSFGCDDPILPFAGFKVTQPYSLDMRGVTLTSRRPMTYRPANGLDTWTMGIYIPPRVGNPTGRHYLDLRDVNITKFGAGVYVTSGPETAINYLDGHIVGGSIDGQVSAVAWWANPNVAAKRLYTERTKFSCTDKSIVGLASHLLYVHPHCAFRAVRNEFHNWASKKYALAHWGNSAVPAPDFAEFDGCFFDESGDGVGIITGQRGPTIVTRSTFNCRHAIIARHHLIINNSTITPKPAPGIGAPGDIINVLTCYERTEAKITASQMQIDMSHLGTALTAGIFDSQTSDAEFNLTDIEVFSKTPHGRITMFSSYTGKPKVKATNVVGRFYKTSDTEHAAGVYSNGTLGLFLTGELELNRCSISGDTSADGTLRVQGAGTLSKIVFNDVDASGVTRGPFLRSDASGAGKVSGTIKTGGRQLIVSDFQNLQLPRGEDPVVRQAAATLVIGSDYTIIRVVGSPSLPVITNILINGRLSDTLAYLGTPLEIVGDGQFLFDVGGNMANTLGPVTHLRLRLDPVTRKWTVA